ncbi:hypothetical protein CTA1_9845 [Colletotrichum tanaceti]|uniref:Uncharacterized protein n=1 Tax=Colletotrichum tanaceti TaxID=1306861 RepID=A0A4U6XJY2_9PEZI|nr:hypothetical protein CTA1_9845 [Colletotrichum tanaceti]
MAPVGDERFNAAHQRILDQMNRQTKAKQQQDDPGRRHHRRHHPNTHGNTHGNKGPRQEEEEEEEEEAGCWAYFLIHLSAARAVLAVIWTVARRALVKPMYRVTKFAFPFLAVLGLFALLAAWAINMSIGGLHALHVWACDDILPSGRLFCLSSSDWNYHYPYPLTPAELSLLWKLDRYFCVFDLGDLLGGMADEQQTYMTGQQREAFAAVRKAGSVVGQLREIGRRQARSVERA